MPISKILKSYLYEQYKDDEALQATRDAFTEYAQEYLDQFIALGLPIYIGLSGDLLNWVGENLYGMARPTLSSASYRTIGMYNTIAFNDLIPYNEADTITVSSVTYETTDDIYKRILTWHYFKGDGKVCTIEWLKRRAKRFLIGTNGIDPGIQTTDDISLSFAQDHSITISASETTYTLMPQFKAAVDSGFLELPFQERVTISVTA